MNNLKCQICGREFTKFISLSAHISKFHKMNIKDYYDCYIKDGIDGICIVCGNSTSFRRLSEGYKKFCSHSCSNKYNNSEWLNSKEFKRKAKHTKLKKYGDENYNNREKYKNTCKTKYGVENTFQSDEVKEKIKNQYGGLYHTQTDSFKEKSKNTRLLKYGDENFTNRKKFYNTCLEKYGTITNLLSESHREKMYNKGIWTRPEYKDEFTLYSEKVRNLTELNYKEYFYEISNAEKRGDYWHLDHKVSVYYGFINNIEPEIIAHYKNLEVIPRSDNCSKWVGCSMKIEELRREIYNEQVL